MKKFILVMVGLCLFINKPIYRKNIKKKESEAMLLEVNGYTFEVELENNTSAKALKEYVSKEKYIKEFSKVEPIDIDKKENNNNLAWSKYEEVNYKTLQNNIKEKFINETTFPLDWENEAWIKVAQDKKTVK